MNSIFVKRVLLNNVILARKCQTCYIHGIKNDTSFVGTTYSDIYQIRKLGYRSKDGYESENFRFSDYNCIGFDLDNTLSRYKLSTLLNLEYSIMAKYLAHKGYSQEYLVKPLDTDFILKGVIVDDINGNLLRIDAKGEILQAAHGTRFLTNAEIDKIYPRRRWFGTNMFINNPIDILNGPITGKMRNILDYYDIGIGCAFSRTVDSIDQLQGKRKPYNVYPDILCCMEYMFFRDHFQTNHGEFFPAIKYNPEEFYHKCTTNLLNWLEELKKRGTILFIVTGSHVDYASHTAKNTLGPGWQNLFDITVCFAQKPGFFYTKRNFCEIQQDKQENVISNPKHLRQGEIYTRGNWEGLKTFLTKLSGKDNPKILYVGDHIVQDIYAPSKFAGLDTVAVCEELEAEGMHGYPSSHPDRKYLVSPKWGSFFKIENTNQIVNWYYMMKKHSKMIVPSLEHIAQNPVDHVYKISKKVQ